MFSNEFKTGWLDFYIIWATQKFSLRILRIELKICLYFLRTEANFFQHALSNESNSDPFQNARRTCHFYIIHLTNTACWNLQKNRLISRNLLLSYPHLMKLFHLFCRAFLMNLFSRSAAKESRWRILYTSARPPLNRRYSDSGDHADEN